MAEGKLFMKTAVVTGASSEIGKVIAIVFAQEGANVVVNYSKSFKQARDAINFIEKMNAHAIAIQTDVSNRKGVRKGKEIL